MLRQQAGVRECFRLIGAERADEVAEFARDVRRGLRSQPKRLSCRYIYDEEGSRLFEQICELPEYYLTRAEREVLEDRADEIAGLFDEDTTLVELGSGNSEKTRLLIEAFLRRHGRLHYVPIDISREILATNALAMIHEHPHLRVTALATEYRTGLRWLERHVDGRLCVAWLGSSIGNFDRPAAREFMGSLAEGLGRDDRMLVGIDLRKDGATLENAYDDAQGVTADFNTNILRRINRDLDGDFDLDGFDYEASYNADAGRVEMYQRSNRSQRVRIDKLDMTVDFAEGERIHTENSHKYSLAEIEALADACDLGIDRRWHDSRRRFMLNLLAPVSGRARTRPDRTSSCRAD